MKKFLPIIIPAVIAVTALIIQANRRNAESKAALSAAQQKYEAVIDAQVNETFDTGMDVGFTAARFGATEADLKYLGECFRRRDNAAIIRWMREHKP